MNPQLLFNATSFRKELLFVSTSFLIILTLPLIAVIVVANTGINLVSETLVNVDQTTKIIGIFDPKGTKLKDLNINTSWPVKGVVTLNFGEVDLPYQPLHTGLDIANPEGKIGDNIVAMMSGKVIYTGDINWGYGKHIIIEHGDNISTLYAHLNKINVIVGQEIKAGEVIGNEGSTGWSTGPHLHFEVRVYGIPVNPRVFLVN